jgi:hypothetical protein
MDDIRQLSFGFDRQVPGSGEDSPSAPAAPSAIVYCVATTAAATGAPCTNPTTYTTIQAAIDAAATGDEIRIAAGTYTGSGSRVALVTKALTIAGGYSNTTTGWQTSTSSTNTVVDGQGLRKSFEIQGALAVTIQNLAVNNGGILNNSGTVNVQTGTLNLQAGGTSNGAFTIATYAKLNFPSGAHTLDPNTTMSGPGVTAIPGGTVTINGYVTAQNLDLTGGAITGSGTLTINGVSNWTAGSMTGTGVTVLASSGQMAISSITRSAAPSKPRTARTLFTTTAGPRRSITAARLRRR